MGTEADPDEPDYPKGEGCVACADAIFGGHTPEHVLAVLEGIIDCPPHGPFDVDGEYLLDQVDGFPCRWSATFEFGLEELFVTYIATDAWGEWNSILELLVSDAYLFDGRSTENCVTSFGNRNDCELGDFTHEGTGIIRWGPDIKPEE